MTNKKPVELTLFLKGKPLAKQGYESGVAKDRSGCMILRRGRGGRVMRDRRGNPIPVVNKYKKEEYKKKEIDYVLQIKQQIPKGFVAFCESVEVLEFTVVFAPLAKHKAKKYESILSQGGHIPKTTKPDLQDNLKKLPFDAMEKAGVMKNDSLVWKESNVSKVYGNREGIIIRLKGL